jgi:pimeloyl-ACP methyl ester carboxylesterase
VTAPTPDMQTRTVEVNGRAVEYLVAGAGPVLVLLHGDGETARDWQWVMPALAAAGHHVVAPSLPGHGGSASADSYAPEDIAAWLGAVVDTLGLQRPTVVGNSLGGLVALHLALTRPEQVERLVLVDSAGLGHMVNPVLAAETAPGVGETAIGMALLPGGAQVRAAARSANLFAQPWRIPPAWWLDQFRWGSCPALLQASVACKRAILDPLGQHHVQLERCGEVHIPTLVVWGLLDMIVPFTHGQAAVERLPKGRLELLAGCGHVPHVECPDAFVATVLRFLAPESDGAGPTSGAPAQPSPGSTAAGSAVNPLASAGLNVAEALVRHTGELARRASAPFRVFAHADALLTPTRAAAVGGLLDRLQAVLSPQHTEPVHALLDRLATVFSPERTAALSALADQAPRLVQALQTDGLPTPRQLRQLPPDIHAILELIDEVHQVVTGMPGAQRARQRGAEQHPQVDLARPALPRRST